MFLAMAKCLKPEQYNYYLISGKMRRQLASIHKDAELQEPPPENEPLGK